MFFSEFFCGFERCGSAAFQNFRVGIFPEKCVRTNSRILHHERKVKEVSFLVRPPGIEPGASSSEAKRSIR